MTHLVIVESPAKAKTIEKYLGKDYKVLASYGHVRDLINKNGAVDPENNFAMQYQEVEKNIKHISAIRQALRKSSSLLLATDPDREGEAIAWSVHELMKKVLKDKPVQRVVFHEITKKAIKDAVDNPREISMDLVDAQQARRALDYLVGFNLSPLLWRKIRRGLSAGRVQSPALRMIVEREEEIEKFVSQEYWTLEALANAEQQDFTGRLIEYNGEKVEQFTITNEEQATKTKDDLLKQANGKLIVTKVDKKQRKRNPTAPFITSTLQQEAVRKLGFTAARTMRIAQQLYEGIDAGEGAVGLITYMRTDSVNLSQDAITEIREYITDKYGKEYLPSEPRAYKTKAKNAQEAHEAIRPTAAYRSPDGIRNKLTDEQYKLYNLIWKRTIACQMIHATIDTVAVNLSCGTGNTFRANGSVISKPGFIKVYLEGTDDQKSLDTDDKILPPMQEGDEIALNDIRAGQHFTEPPPRYSEATLVKTLEEHGIGRPSTYASIISTLQKREYVILDNKRFRPTDVGCIVNKFLTTYFTQYVDYNFTATLEDELDAIARGEKQWVPLLDEFWKPFKNLIGEIDTKVERKDVTQEKIDENCPKCSAPLSIRLGRSGRFIGCTAYPECDYTRNLDETAEESMAPQIVEGRSCPECESDLVIKRGRYGKFIGCSGYPNCKHMEPLEKPEDTEVTCPSCHEGTILKRKSKRGKIFYSCARYPDCTYAIWDRPVAQPCPSCDFEITTIKVTKRSGTKRICPQKECKFSEAIESEEEN